MELAAALSASPVRHIWDIAIYIVICLLRSLLILQDVLIFAYPLPPLLMGCTSLSRHDSGQVYNTLQDSITATCYVYCIQLDGADYTVIIMELAQVDLLLH